MALLPDTNLTSLLIPLKDIQEATDNFDEKNLISSGGGLGPAYKGQLFRSGDWIKIVARKLDRRYGLGELEFWNEVTVLSDLNHPNLVSMIGYCVGDQGEKIIITTYVTRGSLACKLNSPSLTWTRRLNICLGVARALSYLHFEEGRDYSVMHCNINSNTSLLDKNWEPKLSDFEISIKQLVSRMDRVFPSEALGMEDYMDPEIEKTGGVTYKSDVYSFGVVLLEILVGRSVVIDDEASTSLVQLVRHHRKNRTVPDFVHPDLWSQMSSRSVKKFYEIACDCVEEERAHRPEMAKVVSYLEEALEFQLQRENLGNNSDLLKIPLADIKLATKDFSNIYRSTKYFTWYRAQLHHFDKENHSSVIIKRIRYGAEYDAEEFFITEVNVLATLHHPSIVNLLGFCLEGPEMILVIENPSNGYLTDCLQDDSRKRVLTWEKRLKICIDVARAVEYLHSEMEDQQKVIHCNISSETISLDENYGAKIVEFGPREYLGKEDENMSLVADPYQEYLKIGKLRRETDVERFGMVLFGILFGKPAYNSDVFDESRRKLACDARDCDPRERFRTVTLEDMIDPILKEEMDEDTVIQKRGPNQASLTTFITIAYQCLEETKDLLPTMEIVVKELQKALSYQEERRQHPDMYLNFKEFEKALARHLMHEIPEERRQQRSFLGHLRYDSDSNSEEEEELNEEEQQHQSFSGQFSSDSEKEEPTPEHETYEAQEQHQNPLDLFSSDREKKKKLKPELGIYLQERDLAHLKIPLDHIKLATGNFSWDRVNFYSQYCCFYRVQLDYSDTENPSSIEGRNKDQLCEGQNTLVIKRFGSGLRSFTVDQIEHFYTEVKMLTRFKHRNIVNLLGFCDDVYDYLLNEDKRRGLTWEKRLNICIDVAHALNYLHSQAEDQKMIISRYINSRNITLDENLRAKIVDFSRSVALPPDHEDENPSFDISDDIRHYVDPEFKKTGKLRRESDVYSFGVVMFEILRGSIASNFKYWNEYDEGLAYSARGCFEEGSAEEMIDPLIKEETGENIFILNRGANMDSLYTFMNIAYKCVSEAQDDRPTMESVVQELNKAWYLHLDKKNNPVISLERIKKATENFKNCIGKGGFGEVYTGELQDGDTVKTIVAKKWNNEKKQDEGQFKKLFLRELQILVEYKHENVIALVGYCDHKDEKVLVYEYAANGSLDKYLDDPSLTWLKRLDICIGVASALTFFHGGSGKQAKVVHRDIKTANILLTHDWEAKLADFGLSLISVITKETDYVIDGVCGTPGYIDPFTRNQNS